MEKVYLVFLYQLVVGFQTCVEQIFKQFDFLWFFIECGHCSCEGFKQFWDSIDVVVEIGWITVRRQLLKGQQNLVCFNSRKGVFTAKLWLTCGARLLLFSWRSPSGAVGNLFVNCCFHVRGIANLFRTSCHHVRTLFHRWAS